MCDDMTDPIAIENLILSQGPNAIYAFLLWKMIEAQKVLSEEMARIRGMIGVYINGRNRTSKKDNNG